MKKSTVKRSVILSLGINDEITEVIQMLELSHFKSPITKAGQETQVQMVDCLTLT